MSAHVDEVISDLASKLQAGATKDEIAQVLESVDSELREHVISEARKLAGFDEAHEGGTEGDIGDLTGPGAGYDDEPVQVKDRGGVS